MTSFGSELLLNSKPFRWDIFMKWDELLRCISADGEFGNSPMELFQERKWKYSFDFTWLFRMAYPFCNSPYFMIWNVSFKRPPIRLNDEANTKDFKDVSVIILFAILCKLFQFGLAHTERVAK